MFHDRPTLKFDDPFILWQLLQDLDNPKYDEVLSKTTTMDGFKMLLNRPEFMNYHSMTQSPMFEPRWETLHNCQQERASTFKESADNLRTFLEQKGCALQYFGIFPKKPPKNYANIPPAKIREQKELDFKQYFRELQELKEKEYHRLSREQKRYISDQSYVSKRELSDLMPLAPSPGDKRKASIEFALSTSGSHSQAKRAYVERSVFPKRRVMSIDFFIWANCEMTEEEAYKQFSLLDPKDRALFDRQEMNFNNRSANCL
uniref:RGS domain-containing protein n=1 Tax=Panagrellus redivivus TaxID=6233 RepID=A0A7E4ZYV0_PANRE